MLCNASRCSSFTISMFTGGGGGFSTITWVEAWPVRPRESVQVALTVIEPGEVPVVFRVAELPVPEMVPPLDVQVETVTGTPSGLLQSADKLTVPPTGTVVGLADRDIVGGFFGGSGFTVKLAEQLASLFFFSRASVTWMVTV